MIGSGRELCKIDMSDNSFAIVFYFSKRQRNLKKELDTCSVNMESANSMIAFYKEKAPEIESGYYQWAEWGDWGSCEGGVKMRRRSKITVDTLQDNEKNDFETQEGCAEV